MFLAPVGRGHIDGGAVGSSSEAAPPSMNGPAVLATRRTCTLRGAQAFHSQALHGNWWLDIPGREFHKLIWSCTHEQLSSAIGVYPPHLPATEIPSTAHIGVYMIFKLFILEFARPWLQQPAA